MASPYTGSSPRVRGTVHALPRVRRERGIIPARAGNSDSQDIVSGLTEGSSPRVRGTVHEPHLPARQAGIIPARAGNRT